MLFTEGYDSVQDFKFYCPVGGGVEFGETVHAAAEVTGYNIQYLRRMLRSGALRGWSFNYFFQGNSW